MRCKKRGGDVGNGSVSGRFPRDSDGHSGAAVRWKPWRRECWHCSTRQRCALYGRALLQPRRPRVQVGAAVAQGESSKRGGELAVAAVGWQSHLVSVAALKYVSSSAGSALWRWSASPAANVHFVAVRAADTGECGWERGAGPPWLRTGAVAWLVACIAGPGGPEARVDLPEVVTAVDTVGSQTAIFHWPGPDSTEFDGCCPSRCWAGA